MKIKKERAEIVDETTTIKESKSGVKGVKRKLELIPEILEELPKLKKVKKERNKQKTKFKDSQESEDDARQENVSQIDELSCKIKQEVDSSDLVQSLNSKQNFDLNVKYGKVSNLEGIPKLKKYKKEHRKHKNKLQENSVSGDEDEQETISQGHKVKTLIKQESSNKNDIDRTLNSKNKSSLNLEHNANLYLEDSSKLIKEKKEHKSKHKNNRKDIKPSEEEVENDVSCSEPPIKQKTTNEKETSISLEENIEKNVSLRNNEESDDSDSGVGDEKNKIFRTLRSKMDVEESDDEVGDDEFMELLVMADIRATWEIPYLHTLSPNLQQTLNDEAKQKIAQLKLPYRAGLFTPEEDEILEKNWNKMCKDYNIPNCPHIFGRWRYRCQNIEFLRIRRRVLEYLGRNLEHRTLSQIYGRIKTSIACSKKGMFTEEEEEVIELFVTIKDDVKELSLSFLAGVLGRDKLSVWRYMKRRNREEKQFVKWDLESTEKFIKALLEVVNEELNIENNSLDVSVLKGHRMTWDTWKKVAEKMDSYPLPMKSYWHRKVYVQLFAKDKLYIIGIRKKIIKLMYEKRYKYWQDVNWMEIAAEFDNLTPFFVRTRFYMMVRNFCPNLARSVKDSAKFLHKKYILQGQKMNRKRLRRLEFDKEGKLVFKD